MSKPKPDIDEDWAIRKIMRRVIDPDDARYWAHLLAIIFTLLITGTMVFMLVYRISQQMHISPSLT